MSDKPITLPSKEEFLKLIKSNQKASAEMGGDFSHIEALPEAMFKQDFYEFGFASDDEFNGSMAIRGMLVGALIEASDIDKNHLIEMGNMVIDATVHISMQLASGAYNYPVEINLTTGKIKAKK